MNHFLALRLRDDNAVLLQDWTAACLVDLFLTQNEEEQIRTRRHLLSVDPFWLLWSVVNLQEVESFTDDTFEYLVQCDSQRIRRIVSRQLTTVILSDAELVRLQSQQIRAIQNGRLAQETWIDRDKKDQSKLSFVVGALLESEQLIFRIDSTTDAHRPLKNTQPVEWFGAAFQLTVIKDITNQLRLAMSKLDDDCQKLVSVNESNSWHAKLPPIRSVLPKVIEFSQRAEEAAANFEEQLEHEKLGALKELAYGASHEINNPLANISTRAQTLIRNERDPDRKRQLATITSQAYRAHEMIADMMLFAKPPKPEFVAMDLVAFLKELTDSVRDDVDLAHANVIANLPTTPLLLLADAAQLDAAFRAIVKNSVEATGGSGSIEIHVCANSTGQLGNNESPFIEVEIRDDGTGISDEVRRHLFDPFYSGREAGRGLGFGLSKAWRIIEMHNGQIAVSSDKMMGTVFSVQLPRMPKSS